MKLRQMEEIPSTLLVWWVWKVFPLPKWVRKKSQHRWWRWWCQYLGMLQKYSLHSLEKKKSSNFRYSVRVYSLSFSKFREAMKSFPLINDQWHVWFDLRSREIDCLNGISKEKFRLVCGKDLTNWNTMKFPLENWFRLVGGDIELRPPTKTGGFPKAGVNHLTRPKRKWSSQELTLFGYESLQIYGEWFITVGPQKKSESKLKSHRCDGWAWWVVMVSRWIRIDDE